MQDKKTVLLHIAIGCFLGSVVAITVGAALNQLLLPTLFGGIVGFLTCGIKESWEAVREVLFHPISSTKGLRKRLYNGSRIFFTIVWAISSFLFIPFFGTFALVGYLDPSSSVIDLVGNSVAILFSLVFILAFGALMYRLAFYEDDMKWLNSRIEPDSLKNFPFTWLYFNILKKYFDKVGFTELDDRLDEQSDDFYEIKFSELLLWTIFVVMLPVGLIVVGCLVMIENMVSVFLILACTKRMATFSGVIFGSIVAKSLQLANGWEITSTAIVCWLISLSVAYTIYFVREALGFFEEKWQMKHGHA